MTRRDPLSGISVGGARADDCVMAVAAEAAGAVGGGGAGFDQGVLVHDDAPAAVGAGVDLGDVVVGAEVELEAVFAPPGDRAVDDSHVVDGRDDVADPVERTGNSLDREPHEIDGDVAGVDLDAIPAGHAGHVGREVVRAGLGNPEDGVGIAGGVGGVDLVARLDLVERLHRRRGCAGRGKRTLSQGGEDSGKEKGAHQCARAEWSFHRRNSLP